MIVYNGNRLSILHYDKRLHELVIYFRVIGSLNPVGSADSSLSLSLCQGIVRAFHAVPAVITVHRVITAHDGGYFSHSDFLHLCFQLFHKALA